MGTLFAMETKDALGVAIAGVLGEPVLIAPGRDVRGFSVVALRGPNKTGWHSATVQQRSLCSLGLRRAKLEDLLTRVCASEGSLPGP